MHEAALLRLSEDADSLQVSGINNASATFIHSNISMWLCLALCVIVPHAYQLQLSTVMLNEDDKYSFFAKLRGRWLQLIIFTSEKL